MRVISGQARGRKLLGPRSLKIRPVLDKVKEAIFNILFDVKDLKVLDIFAGTGSIGIEALSRGAKSTTFVDDYGPAVEIIKKNLALCKFSDRARIMKATAKEAIARLSKEKEVFDLIFVDPPYLKDLVYPSLELLAKSSIVDVHSIIIVEHHPKETIGPPEGLEVSDMRRYGQTYISFLKKEI